jgi:hypothetical protein
VRNRSEQPLTLACSLVSVLTACAFAVPFAACGTDPPSTATSDAGSAPDGGGEARPDGSVDGTTSVDGGTSIDGGNSEGPRFDVMTWVAPYNQNQWKAALERNTGGAHSPNNTLTRIAAQFWQVQSNGNVSLGASLEDTRWVADYARRNGIKFLTCIHNYSNGWNWGMAVSAFANNRSRLVASIVKAVDDWGADGTDIDFEGNEEGEGDKAEFTAFIKELGAALHAKGKLLTVDTFADQWNKPHPSWWPDWRGNVDGIQSMQYDGGFGGAHETWASYKGQQDNVLAAGYMSGTLAIGMPSWKSDWGYGGLGTSIMDHMNELLSGDFNEQPTSVAIWYAAFEADGWLDREVWDALHQIRSGEMNK